METKRLIPYSVHIPEDIHAKLKKLAKERQASALVRDAITMIIDGSDTFVGGYNRGLRDAVAIIKADNTASNIVVNNHRIGHELIAKIQKLEQKGEKNGNKKKG